MKRSILILHFCLIVFSIHSWGQKSHKHFQHHNSFNYNQEIKFSGLVTGLFLNEVFDLKLNYRKMYFVYNKKKKKWKLKRDWYGYNIFNSYHNGIIAQFENPNGGRNFVVKMNKRGQWFIDAPKRLKRMLKNKVIKSI